MRTCWGWTQIAGGYSTLMTVLSLVVQNHGNTHLNMDTNAIHALVANASSNNIINGCSNIFRIVIILLVIILLMIVIIRHKSDYNQ